ncbi:MAG: glutamate racemase [Pseudomonadota bacterium]
MLLGDSSEPTHGHGPAPIEKRTIVRFYRKAADPRPQTHRPVARLAAPMPSTTALNDTSQACLGVFDSGVGGLSVLRALRRRLPQARLLYAADSGHAPYGERDAAFVIERARALTDHLLREGAQLVVIACNTATAAAAQTLRDEHPAVAIVGVEPGIKPAIALSRNGRIGVMATTGTLASDKFRRLLAAHAGEVELHLQPCPGLATALEAGDAHSAEVHALIARYAAPLRAAGVDTVVLGCTHYPFAAAAIAAALGPHVSLVDTADAVARRVEALLPAGAARVAAQPLRPVLLWTSGDVAALRRAAAHWLDFATDVQALPDTVAPPSTSAPPAWTTPTSGVA